MRLECKKNQSADCDIFGTRGIFEVNIFNILYLYIYIYDISNIQK